MFWAANNTVTQRFFKFQATNDTVATSVAGVQDTGSIGANTSALLRIAHAQSDGLLIKTEEPEVTLTDLPPGTTKMREFKCLGWMATGECSPDGPRNPQNDLNCSSLIPKQASGYCVVEDTSSNERFRVMKRTCAKSQGGAVFRCSDAPGFANFRAEAQVSLTRAQEPGFALPNVETKSEGSSKGIVMVVYPTLMASAYATIRVLYDVLGCQLPIEVWYSSDEMRELPGALTPLQTIGQNNSAGNVTFREINTNGNPIRFEAKIFAIYNSGFDQVLFLDADNAPVRDPSFLFDTPEFVRMGSLLARLLASREHNVPH